MTLPVTHRFPKEPIVQNMTNIIMSYEQPRLQVACLCLQNIAVVIGYSKHH